MLILFDFDGTVADTAPGVLGCTREALAAMRYPVPEEATLRLFLGPPINWAMRELAHVKEEDVEQAVEEFRSRYRAGGMFDCTVFPGVKELLSELREAGHTVAIVSAKPEPFVKQITERLGIRDLFDTIAGAPMDERLADKANNIRRAMEATGFSGRPEEVVMVGDRKYDIEGAKTCGVRSVGVLYGYGSREELETAGADVLAATAEEIKDLLSGRKDGRP